MKKVLSVLTCVLMLSLSGCGADSTTTSNSSERNVSNESILSSEVSDNIESSEQYSSSEKKAASGSTVKLLTREYIHRTDQEDQISSYRAPVYTETALYDSIERYTPDGILLETVNEATYEANESEKTLLYLPTSQLYQKTYRFDESGKLEESKSENANGTLTYWYIWNYDDSGLPLNRTQLEASGDKISNIWTYTYDDNGNIVRREDAYGEWAEFTYDEDGYPLTCVSYDQNGEKYDEWSSFEYREISVESLPEFMGSTKQWILADLVY